MTIENEELDYSVELTKVRQGSPDIKLPGAEFTLYREDDSVINANLPPTDEDGKLVVKDLTPGKYYFIETKAPAGYRPDATPVVFEILENQTEATLVTKENRRRSSGGGGGGGNPPPVTPPPVDPEEPGEPDPEEPSKPIKPNPKPDPEEPGTPGEPGEPDPEEPGTPGEPGEPDPEEPGTPSEPGKPEEPGTPGEPGQPGAPGSPDEPGSPGSPGEPNSPGQPGKPIKPNAPGDYKPGTGSEDPKLGFANKLPQTGEEKLMYMIALGFLFLAAGGTILFRQRRRAKA